MIDILRKDKERLEIRVAELTNQLIALVDKAAARTLNPRAPVTNSVPTPSKPVDPRTIVYQPKQTFADIEAAMARKLFVES